MRFGPAGYPPEGKTTKDKMDIIKNLGLDALEVEFVRGAKISEDKAKETGSLAKERDIRLSAHAPYFISFNSDKQETRDKSIQWVMDTVHAAHNMGAYLIVIHAASYGKTPETATSSVIDGLLKCREIMDDEGKSARSKQQSCSSFSLRTRRVVSASCGVVAPYFSTK